MGIGPGREVGRAMVGGEGLMMDGSLLHPRDVTSM